MNEIIDKENPFDGPVMNRTTSPGACNTANTLLNILKQMSQTFL